MILLLFIFSVATISFELVTLSPFSFHSSFSTIAHSMSSLAALQQRLFELHGMSPSADRDAQIAVLFSNLHRLMQPPSPPAPAPADTMSSSVEAPAPTPIYSNVLSRLVPATFAPALALPKEEPPLPSPSTVLTLLSPVNGAPLYFPSEFWVF